MRMIRNKNFVAMICLLLAVTMLCSSPAIAQGQADGESVSQTGPKKYLTNIVFAGLAGAILGLSTLSFYGRPQERLSNIAVGFAIGVIGGTVFSTYKAASEPREFYGQEKNLSPEYWSTESEDRFTVMQAKSTLAPRIVFEF